MRPDHNSSYVRNRADILRILDNYGVDTIAVNSRDLVGLSEFKLLFDVLEGDKFKLLKELPVKTNRAHFPDFNLRIFRYLDHKPIRDGIVFIPMPHIGRNIRI